MRIARSIVILFLLPGFFFFPGISFAFSDEEVQKIQSALEGKTVGEKIASWAEKFVGRPYDPDPMGEYVTWAEIVADERVDCMYLTFRAVELALSASPEQAVQIALHKRFHSRGMLENGKVINYQDRFEYGEDMIGSGKWGKDVTPQLGRTVRIPGSRGREYYEVLGPKEISQGKGKLRSGDIFFFFKNPENRIVEEGVGHMGIVKVEGKSKKEYYLIHAGGTKKRGGAVKKVPLVDYVSKMPFLGAKVMRFAD